MRWIVIGLILLMSVPMSCVNAQSSNSYQANINKAVAYLSNNFVPKVGLVYESEDPGIGGHWLARTEYPGFNFSYSEVFWLYSDNVFAAAALEPWRLDVSTQINATIQKYSPPFSNKFEAVIGQPVGPDRGARDVIVETGEDYAILYRVHDGSYADERIPYADAIVYRALSEHYLGQDELARKDFNWVASLWNGTCVLDAGVTQTILYPGNAPSDIGVCANMKLALILYASKVLNIPLPHFGEMEAHLWSMQDPETGGIRSLSTGHGVGIGSSNTETTSLTLLIYADTLISRLQGLQAKTDEANSPMLLVAALLAVFMLFSVVHKCRHDEHTGIVGVPELQAAPSLFLSKPASQ